MSEIFVGRQPIYNKDLGVYAYELLFRSSVDNRADQNVAADDATSQTILNSFLEIGLDKIVGERYACFNLTESFLIDEDALPISPDQVIIEIVDDTPITPELLKGVIRLHNAGFVIALDDFHFSNKLKPLAKMAELIKIDIKKMQKAELQQHVTAMKKLKCKLMAVKIETMAEFEECLQMGFDYFQGYFLSKPRIIKGKTLSTNKLSVINIMAVLQNPAADVDEIEQAISSDVSLSYKILKLINSALFALPSNVDSIKQAIVFLGRKKLSSWASMIALSKLDDRPTEMISIAMTRAKMCELLAQAKGLKPTESYFAAGMFSALDILMEQPIDALLKTLPLSDELKSALTQNSGDIGAAVQCAKATEVARESQLLFKDLGPSEINRYYLQAVEWANSVFAEVLN